MGLVQPPQRKGRIPKYTRDRLVELQQMLDNLEEARVFQRPEDAGITVEYLNPSFLVNGGRRSPAVACWASDHWVASSNQETKWRVSSCYCICQRRHI